MDRGARKPALAMRASARIAPRSTRTGCSGSSERRSVFRSIRSARRSRVAKAAGIEEVRSDCLPEDKLSAIEAYEAAGQPVCMVGDGLNDAPALKRATVGIAMGQTGSDIAVDAADIALVRDDIASFPHLLALSKRMLTTIKLNLTFSMTLNFVAIVLAMTGVMGPVVGALVHNAGSVAVIINSALLLSWRRRGGEEGAGRA